MSEAITVRDLLEIKAPDYQPPMGWRGSMDEVGLPPFGLKQINMMLRDSQVKLGASIKTAPLLHIKKNVSGRPDVAEFANRMMDVAWDKIVPKMTDACFRKVFLGQPRYKRVGKLMELDGLVNSYYPADCEFVEVKGKLAGFRVKIRQNKTETKSPAQVDMFGMKSLIYIHGQSYGGREGTSELEGAYSPWLEKAFGLDSAIAKRRLWFHKNSFHSGIIFHPPGEYQFMSGSEVKLIPYRDIARQAIERAESGSVWAFPQVFDEKGNKLWEYVPGQVNGTGQPMIDYVEQLNTEILRGMGIPDDIISQNSGTGSYAGRSIPFQAFLNSQNDTIKAMFDAILEQIIKPLCWWNFQSMDVSFTDIECDRDRLLPMDGEGGPMAGPGGPPGQEMPIDPQQAALAQAAIQGGVPQSQGAMMPA